MVKPKRDGSGPVMRGLFAIERVELGLEAVDVGPLLLARADERAQGRRIDVLLDLGIALGQCFVGVREGEGAGVRR